MRLGLSDEETRPLLDSKNGIQCAGDDSDNRTQCESNGSRQEKDRKLDDDEFLSQIDAASNADHVTTNLLNPPNQLVTCRHWLVLPIAFLFLMAFNCTFYVFGQYVYIKLQRETFPNVSIETKSVCEVNTTSPEYLVQLDIQQLAAKWGIYLYLSGGLMTIISSFVLGTYTDRFGRKFLFILPIVGTTIRTVGAVIGIKYDLPLQYYMIGYFLEGCTGQLFTIFQICYIYVSDITPVGKKRSIGMVLIEVAFGLGTALINVLAGYLLKLTNFLVPFYFSLSLLGVTFILVLLLPETYPKELRDVSQSTTKFENLKNSVDLYFSSKNKGRRWMYILNLIVFTLTSYNLFGRNSVEGLYLLNAPFCWGPEKLGIFGMLKTGCQQLIGMGLVAVFQLFMGDTMIAIVGCISYGASFVLEGIATNDLMLYIVAVIGACGLLTLPMVQSVMSQMTSPHRQGAVFASISAAQCVVNVVGAVSSSTIYIASVGIFRGLTFMVYAGSSTIAFVLLIVFYFGTRNVSTTYNSVNKQ